MKDFKFIVIENLGKSVHQIQLEVAIGYFVNHQGNPFNLRADAAIAWQASAAFMKEMEKAYSALEEVPPTQFAGRELAASEPADENEDEPENSNESKLEG